MHDLAVAYRLPDVDGDEVVGRDARRHLDGAAVVEAERHLGEREAVLAYDRHVDLAATEHERVVGHLCGVPTATCYGR